MAEFVDSTVKEIDNRLRALKEEVSTPRSSACRSDRRSAAARTPRRARARRRHSAAGPADGPDGRGVAAGGATRANQALELVRSQPGITIPQIAEALKIEPNYLYRVMPKLVSEGQITRDGQGWNPVSSA